MRKSHCSKGPFLRRPWFADREFETITAAALRAHDLMPAVPSAVNIELFTELQFGFPYRFEKMPKGVLGVMTFQESGPSEILINKTLDRPKHVQANRCCRSTLAHECGHGLLHAPLFSELWRDYRRCQKRGRAFTNRFEERMENLEAGSDDLKWWEHQANRVMGALLVPRELLLAMLPQTTFGAHAPATWTSVNRRVFADHVSLRFDVSIGLAERRIERIFPTRAPSLLDRFGRPLVSLRRLIPSPEPALATLG